jgi:glycosyltransferase domain-containing protein
MNDLTIAIPVYLRRSTLVRALNYYKDWPCKIIVADSSPTEWKELSKFRHQENLTYIHYADFGYFEKLNAILKSVKTRYYIEVPDDDFLIRTGVESCLSFLRKNNEYVGAMGQFGVFDTLPELKIRSKYLTDYIRSVRNPPEPSNQVKKRAQQLLENFIMWTHCVQKTECALDAVNGIVADHYLKPLDFWDYLLSWSLISKGNVRVLPVLYGVRSKEKGIRGDRQLKRRILLYGLRSYIFGKNSPFKESGNSFVGRQAHQAKLPEDWVRKLYENFLGERSPELVTKKFESCKNYELCSRGGCLREELKQSYLVSQSEDGICLKDLRNELPLYDSKYDSELEQLRRSIEKYPIEREFLFVDRFKKLFDFIEQLRSDI